MPKVHIHADAESRDDLGKPAWCGRGTTQVSEPVFDATPVELRCRICDKRWFIGGQTAAHYRYAVERLKAITQPRT